MTPPPFQAVLDAHRADVYRFLVASVGAAEADDAFQETWIAALRAYPGLERGDNLRAWVLKIAQRKAIDAHRARSRRATPSERLPERTDPIDTGADSRPELWAALRRLPDKQRTAVFCRSVLGMSYAELAELLDSTQDAARRNVHEGLKTLREDWTDE